MFTEGYWTFGIAIALVTIAINVIFLVPGLYPVRWVSPGMALMALFVVYPVLFTIYLSFTNYGDGNLLTRQQAMSQLESKTFLPEDAILFNYVPYKSADGLYMLWMTSPDGTLTFTITPGGEPVPREGEPPDQLDGYTRIPQNQIFTSLTALSQQVFGIPPSDENPEAYQFQVSTQEFGKAGRYEPLYTYDAEQNAVVNNQTGVIYVAREGTFTAPDGQTISPGYYDIIGFQNYVQLFTNPALRQPFMLVFLWTVIFAALSVFLTFALGTFLAIMFDVPEMPGKRLLRALLLIPYAIPAFVSIPVWVGLLNPEFGVISQGLEAIFGWVPPWFADPFWAKVGILLIQVWLGTPYMMVIVTGALQTLPRDVYEAAALDGASAWQAFRNITLPLLLITVGPLLVASFAFNFNNFTVIQLYNRGGPPMVGTATPVGHTDILATYTYRIAFASGRGADQGYAAAITVIIFLILVVITAFQFRYTNMLEERGENV
jgi:ABC-type sugar transport system permease subunit